MDRTLIEEEKLDRLIEIMESKNFDGDVSREDMKEVLNLLPFENYERLVKYKIASYFALVFGAAYITSHMLSFYTPFVTKFPVYEYINGFFVWGSVIFVYGLYLFNDAVYNPDKPLKHRHWVIFTFLVFGFWGHMQFNLNMLEKHYFTSKLHQEQINHPTSIEQGDKEQKSN